MLSLESVHPSEWQSLEVWADPTATDIPYILILVLDELGQYKLYDPAEGYKLILASHDYQEVRQFLREDEYEPVGQIGVVETAVMVNR